MKNLLSIVCTGPVRKNRLRSAPKPVASADVCQTLLLQHQVPPGAEIVAQSTFLSSGAPEQKINTSTQFLLRWGDFKQKQNKSLFCITLVYQATYEFF